MPPPIESENAFIRRSQSSVYYSFIIKIVRQSSYKRWMFYLNALIIGQSSFRREFSVSFINIASVVAVNVVGPYIESESLHPTRSLWKHSVEKVSLELSVKF